MEDKIKLNLFKRLKIALIDLEDYMLFLPEKLSKTIGFVLIMSIILGCLLTGSEMINIYSKYGTIGNYISKSLPDFSYSNGDLIVNDSKIVDAELEKEIEDVLKDNGMTNNEFNKQELVNIVNNLPIQSYVIGIVFYTIFNMLDIFIYWLMTALLIVILAHLLLFFSRIKMKFRAVYTISIYASTLSIILTVLYTILNTCFDIYIDIFDYIFILIAYIYVSAVILLIKSELIKQQLELIKIVKVQKEVKEEMNLERDRKKKDKEEEKEEKEKKSSEKEKQEEIPDEPDGSEI